MAVLLLLTLLLGSNINDASRWITIPFINQSFQTSDLAKVVLVVYLARVLGKHRAEEWTFREVLLKLMLPVGVICGLILPANFSTAAVLFVVCLVIMFIGQVPMKHMVMIVGAAVLAFGLVLFLAKSTVWTCFHAGDMGRVASKASVWKTTMPITKWSMPRSRSHRVVSCRTDPVAEPLAIGCRIRTRT